MIALAALLGVWAVLTAVLLIRLRREYRAASVSSVTAVLLWPWHGLNYALLIVAAALSPWPVELPARVAVPAGALLILLGVVVIGAGFYEFRTVQRLSGTQTDRIVDSGVYRYTRHPQYLGIICTAFGIALIGRSLAALAFAAALSVGFVLYMPSEERYVERSLGKPYRRYRERTPRVVGLPRRG